MARHDLFGPLFAEGVYFPRDQPHHDMVHTASGSAALTTPMPVGAPKNVNGNTRCDAPSITLHAVRDDPPPSGTNQSAGGLLHCGLKSTERSAQHHTRESVHTISRQ